MMEGKVSKGKFQNQGSKKCHREPRVTEFTNLSDRDGIIFEGGRGSSGDPVGIRSVKQESVVYSRMLIPKASVRMITFG